MRHPKSLANRESVRRDSHSDTESHVREREGGRQISPRTTILSQAPPAPEISPRTKPTYMLVTNFKFQRTAIESRDEITADRYIYCTLSDTAANPPLPGGP